jgi:3-deoxy-D-manno-octulosonate 8-phosphate phosphatase (KDO 8-P phosphatase)
MDAGIDVGIVTGRTSAALAHRCNNLGIDLVFDGVGNKSAVLQTVCRQTGVSPENIAFVGDDLPDLSLMNRVGVSIAVADAHRIVIAHADRVTRAHGGHGAVREVCEDILKSQGLWEAAVNRFME